MKTPLLVVLVPTVAAAQPKHVAAILDDLAATRRFEEISISPNGERVAWVETVIDKGRDTGRAAIYIAPVDGKKPAVKLGQGRHVAWAHDSTRIAYIDNQLYVASISGGIKKLTNLKGALTDPAWAPDDAKLAVLFAEGGGGGGPLEAAPAETGVIGGAIHNQRLTLVDLRTAATTQVSPAELNIYEYDWSPDGKTFAVTAAPGPADNNWWTAQLYTMPAATGVMTSIHKPALQLAEPRWSPDGTTIAFIGGLMSDEGFTGGDIYTIAATGGRAVDRTPDRPASPNTFAWLTASQLLVVEYVGGSSAVGTLDLATGKLDRAWQGAEGLHTGAFGNFSASRDGKTVAAIRSDLQHPPEIWVGPVGDWKPITSVNASHHPAWGEAKSIAWTSDGVSVQGWLVYPRDFDATKKYPMIVAPHGGPASIMTPAWPEAGFEPVVFSALGYFVFEPNVRGSYGQGAAFTRANVRDFGGGDLRDLLAGVDAVVKTAPVDPNRLAITGWSYGGYMAMWAITQTNRFKAAVAGAGIANWLSYYGENAIDQWMIPYFGSSVYDDPAVYAKSAPITYIKKVKTPTLIVVGERDGECPAPQSYEFWHALRALGVPADLVVYAGEGHLFRDTAHRRDVLERAAAWFDKYVR